MALRTRYRTKNLSRSWLDRTCISNLPVLELIQPVGILHCRAVHPPHGHGQYERGVHRPRRGLQRGHVDLRDAAPLLDPLGIRRVERRCACNWAGTTELSSVDITSENAVLVLLALISHMSVELTQAAKNNRAMQWPYRPAATRAMRNLLYLLPPIWPGWTLPGDPSAGEPGLG